MKKKSEILLVGITPPPFHGQSIATGLLFDHDWKGLVVERLPINYSKNVEEIGKASFRKVFHLFHLVWKCWKIKWKTRAKILYYTPASANNTPFIRDVIFLMLCRPFFKATVLHYHAGGLPEFLEKSRIKKWLGKLIYGRKAWSLALSDYVPVPDESYGAKKKLIVPNGVDVPKDVIARVKLEGDPESNRFLFVGNLYEEKGIFDAIEAIESAAKKTGKSLELAVMGVAPTPEIQERLVDKVESSIVKIALLGLRRDEEKWKEFLMADAFIFPSYYQSENQPLVILEAMACGLPILSTTWRGIPGQVDEGETGLLVEPNNVPQLTQAVCDFLTNEQLRAKMGKKGMEVYNEKYTTKAHIKKMREIFEDVLAKIDR